MALIQKSEFKGKIKISQNTKETDDLQDYIDDAQEEYLRALLGDAEYTNFVADLSAQGFPQSQKWKDFVDGVNWTDENGYLKIYKGVKEMLRYFTFYEYMRDNNAHHDAIGVNFSDSENSERSSQQELNVVLQKRYNKGVRLYNESKVWLCHYAQEICYPFRDIFTGNFGLYDFQFAFTGDPKYITIGDSFSVDIHEGILFNCVLLDSSGVDFSASSSSPIPSNPSSVIPNSANAITGNYCYNAFPDWNAKDLDLMVFDGWL